MRNNGSQPLDRACAGRVLPQRNVNSHFIIIGAVLRKNSPEVLFAEHNQIFSAIPRKYPPAKPGALVVGPLKAAVGVANAAQFLSGT